MQLTPLALIMSVPYLQFLNPFLPVTEFASEYKVGYWNQISPTSSVPIHRITFKRQCCIERVPDLLVAMIVLFNPFFSITFKIKLTTVSFSRSLLSLRRRQIPQ